MKPRVLIVDDSITVRMDLKEGLEEAGFTTSLSATLASARLAISRDGFDVVILDVHLPDGDGIAYLQELKSSPSARRIPVMLLSSESEVADRIRGLKTGADEYVGKPYDQAQVVSRARELARRGKDHAREKPMVLLIDDSPTFLNSLKDALEGGGFEPVTAMTGEDGLRRSADLRPDAVIVDGVLPGIDGLEVIRRIRSDAALRRTPCLLLTASMGREQELNALEAGADLFVFKDEDMDVVLAKLRGLLRLERAPAPEADRSLLGPKRILAVDGDRAYVENLSDRLRDEGYDLVSARSGDEARDLLAVQKVDAILLGASLPGMPALEFLRGIKSSPDFRRIPLLMLSDREEREALLEGINAGADDYITKSARFDILMGRLNAQLRRSQFEEENRRARDEMLRREMEALEVQAVKELADERARHIGELERANEQLRRAKEQADELAKELESFSYSVSHDLRAPLRGIDGFSQILVERHGSELGDEPKRLLGLVRQGAQRMGVLIEDMLSLAMVTRAEIKPETLDLSAMAAATFEELRRRDPGRTVEVDIAPGLAARADRGLLRILFENLLGNAWKFTSKNPAARISFSGGPAEGGGAAFTVRDNGAGFDMEYAHKLFQVFQRLHLTTDFPGTGVGLATVARVIKRHGGRIWAEGKKGEGAAFHFTLEQGAPAGS